MGAPAVGIPGIRGEFFWRLESRNNDIWTPLLASKYTSTSAYEIYKWLDEIGAVRKFDGPRVAIPLTDAGLTVINEDFEHTIAVHRDDLTFDKTGQVLGRVREQADRVAELPDKLISTLITNNGNSYDGVAFFHASNHASGANAFSVAGTSSGSTTAIETVIKNGTSAFRKMKDAAKEPMHKFARKFVIMIPPDLEGATAAAIRNLTIAEGSNISRSQLGAMQDQFKYTYEPITNERLTAQDTIYMFRADAPIGAFIWQEVGAAEYQTLGVGSEHTFKTKEVLFGAYRKCAAALGRHQNAVRLTLAA